MPDFAELEKQYHRCMTISAARVADQVRYLAQSGHPQSVHPAHGVLVDPQPPSASALVSHPAPAQTRTSPSVDLGPGYNIFPLPGPFDHLLTSPAGPSSLVDSDSFQLPPWLLSATLHNSADVSAPLLLYTSPTGSSDSSSASALIPPALLSPPAHIPPLPTATYPHPLYPSRTPSAPSPFTSPTSRATRQGDPPSAANSNVGLGLPCLPELVLPPNPTFPVFSQLPQLSAPLLGFTHPPILPIAPPHTPTRYIHDLDPVVNLAADRGRLATFHLPNSRRRPSLPNTARDHVPEGEKWLDKKERRKAQNRIAQRRFREKGKGKPRDEVFGEHGSGSSQSTMVSTPPSDERRFSGEDDSGDSSAGV